MREMFRPLDHRELDPNLAQRDFFKEHPEATGADFARWWDAFLAAIAEDGWDRE